MSAKCKNGICVCVCACVCVYLCVCGVPNIKLVKGKNGICLCVPVSVYVHVSVCGMPLINLVSLACLPMSQKVQNVNFLKIHNFKSIIDRCIISFLVDSPSIGA